MTFSASSGSDQSASASEPLGDPEAGRSSGAGDLPEVERPAGGAVDDERLLRWLRDERAPANRPSLPHPRTERYDPGRHFDETGRWLAKAVVILFGFTIVGLLTAIAFRLGDTAQIDAYERLVIPSLAALVGAAAGFYFRGRSDLKE